MNVKMILDFFVPGYDTHFEKCAAQENWPTLTRYQKDRLGLALPYIKNKEYAVDIGANIGIYTVNLANRFINVFAFEPDKLNFECLRRNTRSYSRVKRFNYAIGDCQDKVNLVQQGTSGGIFVSGSGSEIEQRTLDSFNLPGCSLLKIDVEGYEYFVVQGALETIKKYRPVIILEEKNFLLAKDTEETHLSFKGRPEKIPFWLARRTIEDLDYVIAHRVTHDFILVPVENRCI